MSDHILRSERIIVDTTLSLSHACPVANRSNRMKTTTPSLQFFHPIVLATFAATITCGLCVPSAQAGYVVTLEQVGPNVVATGSGALDLTGLSYAVTGAGGSGMEPSAAFIITGTYNEPDDLYRGSISGPTSFGSGFFDFADRSTATGGIVGIAPVPVGVAPTLYVPGGYVSNSLVSDSATYDSSTFSSLGVTPGTYVWDWGTGPNQNFTLKIGAAAAVPDTGSTIGLLVVPLLALVGVSRFRSLRLAQQVS